ncbi:hypothetical protein SAMN05428642_101251 [Flaviramulus basaltis]|uniref:Tetratricopeptide repeat-containing protein n=1 Tax=Flaviramulus basaltis TaxID=369401 RepID=A0A1K2IAZ6_9FLAO|nr:hypothetical protein [Flaviramulus basaltis]SFZ89414.1 hypothetical protein SAMN05428642_101251 [Flaviramulus basaltis]
MNNSKLIENYFSRTLTKIELEEFNSLYKNNSEFKLEVDFLKNLKTVSEKEDDSNFKSKLKGFEEEVSSKKVRKNKLWKKPLTIGAAILLIAFCINFLWIETINEDQLFTNYFEPSKNVSTPIVRSANEENTQNEAFINYSEHEYENASILFEKAYEKTKKSELLFYQGNALLALGKSKEAINKFKQHLTFLDSLSNRTHWYLALAYLKNKDLKQTKQQLELLLNSNEVFKKEEASSLLKKLK